MRLKIQFFETHFVLKEDIFKKKKEYELQIVDGRRHPVAFSTCLGS